MARFTAVDCERMAQALRLAERGRLTTRPNPMVGCVIVKDDRIIGEGYHRRAGEEHAEILALAAAGEAARGATVYVTLEPCSHHGRTPPCADALIEAGVGEVVVAMRDPSDDVDGQGLARLEAAGVTVRTGCLEDAAMSLNRGFVSRVTRARPFLRLKLAMSLDGGVAMSSGESQWITGQAARADVQRLRAESGAVLCGIGTALADDPSLNVRDPRFADVEQPLRVVLDSRLRLPGTARMLKVPGETLVFTTSDEQGPEGATVIRTDANDEGRVHLAAALAELARRGVNDLLVECGPALAGALLDERLVDELVIYQSPHMMGSETRRAITTPRWLRLSDRLALNVTDRRAVGMDIRITARLAD